MVQRVDTVTELVFYIIDKAVEIILIVSSSCLCLVVTLKSYYCRVLGITFHKFTYDTFTIEAECFIGQVSILPDAVIGLFTVCIFGKYFRMTFCHPRWN